MRPGHFCPGNEVSDGVFDVRPAASMRPGHFCPGNPARGEAQPRRCYGFNEAGAFLPRKRRGRR